MGLREELLAQGCVEKKNRARTIYCESITGEIIAKVCRKCGELKTLCNYMNDKSKLGGVRSECRACKNIYTQKYYLEKRKEILACNQKWREQNKERYLNYRRNWLEENKEKRKEEHRRYYRENTEKAKESQRMYHEKNREKIKEYQQKWQKENPDKVRLKKQRYLARKQSLPDDLTNEEQHKILSHFSNTCALTGACTEIHLDHVIPLATGRGGTTHKNMVPLRGDLNSSKRDSNLFEWFESNRQRFKLSQERFYALVKYLADVNEMTVEEYKAYYNGCFEGKAEESA